MEALADVFLQVRAGDAHARKAAVELELDVAVGGGRLVVLRDLVILRHVRIEIILPVELGERGNLQFSSKPVSAVSRSASSLATGSTPGRPRQTGQTWVFGGAPNSLAQPHHIFDFVLSWTWVSRPMTASYSIIAGEV